MQELGEEKLFGNNGLLSFFPGKVAQEIAALGREREGMGVGGRRRVSLELCCKDLF